MTRFTFPSGNTISFRRSQTSWLCFVFWSWKELVGFRMKWARFKVRMSLNILLHHLVAITDSNTIIILPTHIFTTSSQQIIFITSGGKQNKEKTLLETCCCFSYDKVFLAHRNVEIEKMCINGFLRERLMLGGDGIPIVTSLIYFILLLC